MRKLLIIYLVISFLLVIVYTIFAVNAYVSIKYEVETIDNDIIISMIYQIFDAGVIVNFIWFVINMLIILGMYMKFRFTQKNEYEHAKDRIILSMRNAIREPPKEISQSFGGSLLLVTIQLLRELISSNLTQVC